jgi:hypothetical protein
MTWCQRLGQERTDECIRLRREGLSYLNIYMETGLDSGSVHYILEKHAPELLGASKKGPAKVLIPASYASDNGFGNSALCKARLMAGR